MKKLIPLLLAMLWGIAGVWAQTDVLTDEYAELMGRADKAIEKGHFTEAEDLLRQAVRENPSSPLNPLLLSNIGMIQYYDGRTDEALSTLGRAHELAPASVTILMNRARVFTAEGNAPKALADYQEVIRLDSTLVEPRFYHAMLSLNTGDATTALADVETLADIAPDHRLTHLARATIDMHTGNIPGAIQHYGAILDREPDATTYGSRAMCYLLTSQLPEAADDIARGLDLDPMDAELYTLRAMLNKMRYRPDDAKADAEKAIQLGANAERVKQLLR